MSGIPIDYIQWAYDLVNPILRKHDYPSIAEQLKIVFWLPKRGKRRHEVMGGHAMIESKKIELATIDTVESVHKRWVLVHEIAHFIDISDNGHQKSANGKQWNHHPQSFWDIAVPLFDEYGLLDEALKYEYSKGKKQIRYYMGRK